MAPIRRIVLDVLKPHTPSIIELSQLLAELDGIDGVDITLCEMDRKVESVKLTIEGSDVSFDDVERVINESGGTVHSIDKVATGRRVVEEAKTD